MLALMSKPSRASVVIHDNGYWRERFVKRFGHTNPLTQLEFSAVVPEEAELGTYTFSGGGSMITDLLLLKHLAALPEVNSYFEIGTWRGESMRAVLPNVTTAFSLDLDHASMKRLGFSDDVMKQFGILLDETSKLKQFKSDSGTFDYNTVGTSCDLIFIDGDHTYEYVKRDTRNVVEHLTHVKTIIVWHDYCFDPEKVRWEVYAGILDGLPSELQGHVYHIRNTKCAVLLRPEILASLKVNQAGSGELQTWSVTIKRKQTLK